MEFITEIFFQMHEYIQRRRKIIVKRMPYLSIIIIEIVEQRTF